MGSIDLVGALRQRRVRTAMILNLVGSVCTQDERRRAILSAWACTHGLAEEASSSLLDLLLFYDTKLREEELPPVLLSPAKASGGAAASGAAASGAAFGGRSASSAAAAQLRKMIIDDSLAGYLAEPAALHGFVVEAAEGLDAPLLRRLLEARAPAHESADGSATASSSSSSRSASSPSTESGATGGHSPWRRAQIPQSRPTHRWGTPRRRRMLLRTWPAHLSRMPSSPRRAQPAQVQVAAA